MISEPNDMTSTASEIEKVTRNLRLLNLLLAEYPATSGD